MSILLYNIFLFFFIVITHVASLFDAKAKKWVLGRRHVFRKLREAIPAGEKTIWVHCASLGEFEQGKPVMEQLRIRYPEHKILLTFFSPSGFEAQKNFEGADWIFYLPADGPANARRFLEIVQPELVIFVKYEFWYYYLKKIRYRNIPLLLVSALFRKDMSFFTWYGGLQRKMLARFDHLFVQNESSKKLIDAIGLAPITSISGDTRFDRVLEIASQWKPIPGIDQFIDNGKALVAGSTWPEDEVVLQKAMGALHDSSLKLIIAPHETQENHIAELEKLFPGSVRYSRIHTPDADALDGIATSFTSPVLPTTLIIDNIGMLSRLYKYGYLTYVGGGLRKMGVHNVLEAAVFSKPVLFGAEFGKYSEATGLVNSGGGLPFHDEERNGARLGELIDSLISNMDEYDTRSRAAGEFVQSQRGATQKILQYIQEKRLLTS